MMQNVRVFFEKGNGVKYISHLDINRCFARAFKRAALPVWYTEGFNPHPFLVFSPPLSVGFIGENEICDFRLEKAMNNDEIMERLNNALPKGIRAVLAVEPKLKISETAFAKYRIVLEDNIAPEMLQKVHEQKEIFVIKKSKTKEKEIDLKEYFENVNFQKEEDGIHFNVILPCDGNLSINPSLILEGLRKYVAPDITVKQIYRVEFLDKARENFI